MQRILKSTMELTFQFEAEKHKIIIQNFNGKKENVVYTEQSLGEALLTRGLIKKKDEEILQDCFARCCMGELRRAAQTDALTGLWNVGGGKEHIQKILAGQKEEEINGHAMFLMDVDNFKSVNDTMGHMVGDETLKQLAQVLKNSFEKEDVVFRLGGDEFAAFVRNMENPDEKIAQIMCRMKHELEAAREAKKFCDTGTEKRKDTG